MSQPPIPPTDGPAPYLPPSAPAGSASSSGMLSSEPVTPEPAAFPPPGPPYSPPPYSPPPVEPDPGVQWTVAPAPSWTQPWEPPAPPVAPAAPLGAARPRNPLVLVLVAVVAALLGAVTAGLVVTAVFLPSAQEIGEEVGAAAGPGLEDSVSDGITDGMDDAMEDYMGFMEEDITGGIYPPAGPVEQFPATEPGDLGPDPVLDAYADNCFTGDLQACDDLYYESPPLSDYESYGWSCGGRVKAYTVDSCTELE